MEEFGILSYVEMLWEVKSNVLLVYRIDQAEKSFAGSPALSLRVQVWIVGVKVERAEGEDSFVEMAASQHPRLPVLSHAAGENRRSDSECPA